MARLFVSYSHHDNLFRCELEKHFASLRREGLVETWFDRDIDAGDELHTRIRSELDRADIILLLVSSDFIASDYCFEVEMGRALERHRAASARVIPVILRPCDWQATPLGNLKALPEDGRPVSTFQNQDEALLQVATAIRKVLTSRRASSQVQADRRRASSDGDHGEAARPRNRVRRTFSDHDRDEFAEEVFECISTHFEESLRSLEEDNVNLKTRFRRVEASMFLATIYVNGAVVAQCKIWNGPRGSLGGGGIGYSEDVGSQNSYNDMLTIADDGYQLFAKPLMAPVRNRDANPMNKEHAASYYWDLLTERLK